MRTIFSLSLVFSLITASDATAAIDAALREAIEAVRYEVTPAALPGGAELYEARNPGQRFQARFSAEALWLTGRDSAGSEWSWGLRLAGVGRAGPLAPVPQARLAASGSRIELHRGLLVEWYVNEPRGIEQGFTLNERPPGPAGGAPLKLELAVLGHLTPQVLEARADLGFATPEGEQVLRYNGLHAQDAAGRALPTELALVTSPGGEPRICLAVDDAGARYPVAIDPLVFAKKLRASDAAADDWFGASTAISGDTVVVGASQNDDAGSNSGSAYIFERDQGGAGNWGQAKKLTASDASEDAYFGIAVGISGDTAVVGASGRGCGMYPCGAAYVFERDQGGAGNWGQVKRLLPVTEDGGNFGASIAISGDTILVGAPFDDIAGYDSGLAYIFERDQGGAGNWGLAVQLTPTGAAARDYFGDSVAISGDTAVVGASGGVDATPNVAGSAYVFERDQGGAENWGEVKKLTASDAAAMDFFGGSVDISGDTAVVGASGNDDAGERSGSAYVFERDQGGTENWGEVKKLTASDAAERDYFGWSAAISADTALLGAWGNDDAGYYSGSAYLFQRDQGGAGNWGEVEKLTAFDAAEGDYFGRESVAISNDTALIGAIGDESVSGSVYLYTFSGLRVPTLSNRGLAVLAVTLISAALWLARSQRVPNA